MHTPGSPTVRCGLWLVLAALTPLLCALPGCSTLARFWQHQAPVSSEARKTASITEKSSLLVSYFSHEQFVSAASLFDDQLRAQLPPHKLASMWNQLNQEYGPFDQVGTPHQILLGDFRSVTTPLAFAKRTIQLKLVFTEAEQITGIVLLPAKK